MKQHQKILVLLCATAAITPAAGDDAPPLTNAALPRYGARLSVSAAAAGGLDPSTPPSALLDNNVHTRCVLRGAPPYTFTVELPFPVLVDRLAFANSDYAAERVPEKIEITLDNGAVTAHTLALKRPDKRRAAWQQVPIGKTARVVTITVRSNHEPSKTVNWGGLAEIAVLTPDNLDARFAVPGAVADAAHVFVHTPPPVASSLSVSAPRVRLPARVAPGEHPRLVISRSEVDALKTALQSSDKGRAALKSLIGVADAALAGAPVFPDPRGPLAQLKDRGDAVAKQHGRLSINAGNLGMAYALTKDARYASRAAELLRGYAERYAVYPEHKGVNKSDTGKVMGQRLSEAMWLIPLIEAYDYVYESGALSPVDKTTIEQNLFRAAVTFIRSKEPAAEVAARDRAHPSWRTDPPRKAGAANWLLYYNTATMMVGALTGDQHLLDLAAADFRSLIAHGVGEDGMWLEGAIGYQFFALTALVPGLETAARQGIDLWSFDNSRVKRLFDSPLRYAYPDGSAPGINDGGRARLGNWSTMAYDYAFLRYNKAAYAPLINASPRQVHFSEAVYFPTRWYAPLPQASGASSGQPSTIFANLGYAILRAPEVYALLDYGPHGGVHGHPDKLNLLLFAGGDEMGGEPRFHRYEDALHGQWTTQTVAHNTLTVDETSQIASQGTLLLFEDTPTFKVMRAQSDAAVPGALLDRTVVVTPDGVLDLFRGRSAWSRTWDRTLRFQGNLRSLPAAEAAAAAHKPLGARDGYQHLRVAARQPAMQEWKGAWQTTVGTLDVTLAGAPRQQVILARGPDNDAVALARQQGERADFAVAYALEAWPNAARSVRQPPTGDPDLSAAEMTHPDGTVTMVIVAHGKTGSSWQALGWKSDARVLCLRRKGATLDVLLTGGTFVQGKEGVLRFPAPGNYGAARRTAKGTLEVVSRWAR